MDYTKYLSDLHNHDHRGSNLRIKDSNNFVEDLIDVAYEKGVRVLGITNHESLSSHVEAMNHAKKYEDLKLVLGNEIYLISREEHDALKAQGEKIKYYHFILLAKDKKGHEFLRRLSSQTWEGMYTYRGLERVPTFIDDLEELIQDYKGHVIASSACLGSYLGENIVVNNDLEKAEEFIQWCQKTFGDLFFLELQPSHSEEQQLYNKTLLELSKKYGIKYHITTDTHYLRKEDKETFWTYLLSDSSDDREVEKFYDTTYMMDREELLEYFDEDILNEGMKTGLEIGEMVETYSLDSHPILPPVIIPEGWDKNYVSKFAGRFDLPYIQKYLTSPYEEDRYYLYLCEEGMKAKNKPFDDRYVNRIEEELDASWELSDALGERMSKYHISMKQQIDLMWEVSLVGPSRGSACCFLLNYLLDIVQVNPLDWDLPMWRYMDKTKVELSDIDVDTEGAKRFEIIDIMRKVYGEDRVINVCTFSTEGSNSVVLSCCRALNIPKEVATNLTGLIPNVRGESYTISQMLYGDEEKEIKPNATFIRIVDEYPGLREALLKNAKVVKGRSQHASAVAIFPKPVWHYNATMKTSKGIRVTQFEAHDSEQLGLTKFDYLTVNALDRMRTCFDLLLDEGLIEWQGTLRKTWNYYFHPDIINLTNAKMFDILYHREMSNAFQFTSAVGLSALSRLKATRFMDIVLVNSLMRLNPTDIGDPLERYKKFKSDITLWYKEMEDYGLNQDEIQLCKELFEDTYGVLAEQEGLMETGMKVCGYDVRGANKLRKSVSKKSPQAQLQEKKRFFEEGIKNGRRKLLLQYIWDYEIAFLLG